MLSSDHFHALLSGADLFFSDERYRVVGQGIRRRRPAFALLFRAVSVLSTFRAGNFALVAVVILFYGAFRQPKAGPLFQYGMSDNNVRSFRRINAAAGRAEWDDLINGLPISIWTRVQLVMDLRRATLAAGALTRLRSEDPFSHTQLVICAAALLLYASQDFRDVRLVCIASDHSPINMALLHVARLRGLKICYLQHAPVAEHFPPLDYDLSVLFDGKSAGVYDRAAQRRNTKTRGRIVALPPFDTEYVPISLGPPPFRIGICLSYLFNAEGVTDLVQQMEHQPAVSEVKLRRHPRCTSDIAALLDASKVAEESSGSVANFVDACDIVLVPNSGVAIEALHLGKPTCYTPNVDFISYDYYGFVRAGVLPIFSPEILDDPAKLVAFFGEDWRRRYSDYDPTAEVSLSESQRRAGKAFLALLADRT